MTSCFKLVILQPSLEYISLLIHKIEKIKIIYNISFHRKDMQSYRSKEELPCLVNSLIYLQINKEFKDFPVCLYSKSAALKFLHPIE